ncbi:MAG: endonuclease/exonuclease/phosphatase family protein [Halioglobus sp.]
MNLTPINKIQGDDLWSPLAGETVRTRGVVTGHSRRGFFIQDPKPLSNPAISDAVFVYSPKRKPPVGVFLELEAKVIDYVSGDNGKPVTQLKMLDGSLLEEETDPIEPFILTAQNLPLGNSELALFLNGLEGMLLGIEAGATFIQASNPFGDYVVSLKDDALTEFRTAHGGVVMDAEQSERWFPSFRIIDYADAPRLNVGATLLNTVIGPLNFRSGAYQIAVNHGIDVEPSHIEIGKTTLQPLENHLTILTLNSFNLDVHIESAEKVKNPSLDIDDDVGDGRFDSLAKAVVSQAGRPDIIALQEIQDNDGAELSTVVQANKTLQLLAQVIGNIGGPEYAWVDIPPKLHSDGGQPGGNIRNAYLYNKDRVELVKDSVKRLGENSEAFEDSRKPLVAHFKLKTGATPLAMVNVHLASKRHQHSFFSPENPGFDPQLNRRVQQAQIVRDWILELETQGIDYLVTGDFNDFEDSPTLRAMLGDESANLVKSLPKRERYDYNHRGKLHVLMHALVSKTLVAKQRAEYEILHGNELLGVRPGDLGTKPSDHAYVISRIKMA